MNPSLSKATGPYPAALSLLEWAISRYTEANTREMDLRQKRRATSSTVSGGANSQSARSRAQSS